MKRAWRSMALIIGFGLLRGIPVLAESDPCRECRMVADQELAEIRGGYVTGDGLKLSFGIEAKVMIDGVVQTVNTLTLPQTGAVLGQFTGGNSSVSLIQNGTGNIMDPAVLAGLQSGYFTFVQNSLDNVAIQNITQINASVTVINLFRDINLGTMMNQQMINSFR